MKQTMLLAIATFVGILTLVGQEVHAVTGTGTTGAPGGEGAPGGTGLPGGVAGPGLPNTQNGAPGLPAFFHIHW
jgi:hypothetical protein